MANLQEMAVQTFQGIFLVWVQIAGCGEEHLCSSESFLGSSQIHLYDDMIGGSASLHVMCQSILYKNKNFTIVLHKT